VFSTSFRPSAYPMIYVAVQQMPLILAVWT
jgi:hypothetical protein